MTTRCLSSTFSSVWRVISLTPAASMYLMISAADADFCLPPAPTGLESPALRGTFGALPMPRAPEVAHFKLCGPKASGINSDNRLRSTSGPSQTLITSASGPNSLITWRQAPQGALGFGVGV